jgi:hypothetical protein
LLRDTIDLSTFYFISCFLNILTTVLTKKFNNNKKSDMLDKENKGSTIGLKGLLDYN